MDRADQSVTRHAAGGDAPGIQIEWKEDHNDLCEVCSYGGDLLCCDTCSLVFHTKCLRPELKQVPEGDFSCQFCIADSPNVSPEEREEAQRNVAAMRRVQSMYMPETRGDTLVDEKQKAEAHDLAKAAGDAIELATETDAEVTRLHQSQQSILGQETRIRGERGRLRLENDSKEEEGEKKIKEQTDEKVRINERYQADLKRVEAEIQEISKAMTKDQNGYTDAIAKENEKLQTATKQRAVVTAQLQEAKKAAAAAAARAIGAQKQALRAKLNLASERERKAAKEKQALEAKLAALPNIQGGEEGQAQGAEATREVSGLENDDGPRDQTDFREGAIVQVTQKKSGSADNREEYRQGQEIKGAQEEEEEEERVRRPKRRKKCRVAVEEHESEEEEGKEDDPASHQGSGGGGGGGGGSDGASASGAGGRGGREATRQRRGVIPVNYAEDSGDSDDDGGSVAAGTARGRGAEATARGGNTPLALSDELQLEVKREEGTLPGDVRAFRRLVRSVVVDFSREAFAMHFWDAVDLDLYPRYVEVVAEPMHLAKIMFKLRQGEYDWREGRDALLRDINLIPENCEAFNGRGKIISENAHEVARTFIDRLHKDGSRHHGGGRY